MEAAVVASAFAEAQRTAAAHRKAVASIAKLVAAPAAAARAAAAAAFLDCVSRVLLVWKADPAVDRLCAFIVQVALAANGALVTPLLEVRGVPPRAASAAARQTQTALLLPRHAPARLPGLPAARRAAC
jgi:hypothetical protein